METIIKKYPGKSSEEIFDTFRTQIWERRKEITSFKQLDAFLKATKWNEETCTAKAEIRILLMKVMISAQVSGDILKVRLQIPVKSYEEKYSERIKKILETLFGQEQKKASVGKKKVTKKKVNKKKVTKKKVVKKKVTKKRK
jgi:hypothetical protein